ncbi:MAG: FCD domain-containing protein [Candidatus Dormiibacterota bacterium]
MRDLSSKTYPSPDREEERPVYRPGYEVAAERILQLVAAQHLLPGDRLPTEQDLALRFGVSRPVVREAVKILAALGRVTVRKGVGILVADHAGLLAPNALDFFSPADPADMELLFEFRVTQESAAARLAAARIQEAQLAALRAGVERSELGAEAGDLERFGAGDDAVHDAIVEAAGNPFFGLTISIARRLQQQAVVIALGGDAGRPLAKAAAEHRAIADAIADGDGEAAAARMSAHIYDTLVGYRREMRRRHAR